MKLGEDPAILIRSKEETRQIATTALGPAILKARMIPNSRVALIVAARNEGLVLKNLTQGQTIERVFSTGARLINGGLNMIIKGVLYH